MMGYQLKFLKWYKFIFILVVDSIFGGILCVQTNSCTKIVFPEHNLIELIGENWVKRWENPSLPLITF